MLAAAALALLAPHAQHLLGANVVRHQVAEAAPLKVEPAIVGGFGEGEGSHLSAVCKLNCADALRQVAKPAPLKVKSQNKMPAGGQDS